MRVVILGGKGQLGFDLMRTAPEGFEVIPLGRKDLDITDREQVFEKLKGLKPDFVINSAAYVKVDAAEDETEQAFAVNAAGVKNVVDYCAETDVPLLHVSTDYVFDGKKAGKPYEENDVPNPVNIYGNSKLAGEYVVKNYLKKFYIVRSSSLYGVVGASGKGGNFPYAILNRAKKGESLRVVDDIFMVPTYTRHLAEAIWELITKKYPFGLYHLVNEGYCSWYEFAKTLVELAGFDAEITPVKHTEFPTKARRPLWSVLKNTKGPKLPHWRKGAEEFVKEAKELGKI